jgi:hypothetical protein
MGMEPAGHRHERIGLNQDKVVRMGTRLGASGRCNNSAGRQGIPDGDRLLAGFFRTRNHRGALVGIGRRGRSADDAAPQARGHREREFRAPEDANPGSRPGSRPRSRPGPWGVARWATASGAHRPDFDRRRGGPSTYAAVAAYWPLSTADVRPPLFAERPGGRSALQAGPRRAISRESPNSCER